MHVNRIVCRKPIVVIGFLIEFIEAGAKRVLRFDDCHFFPRQFHQKLAGHGGPTGTSAKAIERATQLQLFLSTRDAHKQQPSFLF